MSSPAEPRAGVRTVALNLLRAAAVLLTVYSVGLVFTSNFNMGNLLVWLLTAAVDCYAVWHRPINRWFSSGPGRVVGIVLLAGALLYGAVLVFVAVSGYTNSATGQEQAIVVLGAGLRGDRPSLLLRYRLDKAYEYACAHPDMLVVTSGGQGRDEWVPEGQAMRDYLIDKGLDPDRVLAETRSTSTEENFAFSRQILLDRGLAEDMSIVLPLLPCRRVCPPGRLCRPPRAAGGHFGPQRAALLSARGAGGPVLLGVQDFPIRLYAPDGGHPVAEQKVFL